MTDLIGWQGIFEGIAGDQNTHVGIRWNKLALMAGTIMTGHHKDRIAEKKSAGFRRR
jgi:hypothetical protein